MQEARPGAAAVARRPGSPLARHSPTRAHPSHPTPTPPSRHPRAKPLHSLRFPSLPQTLILPSLLLFRGGVSRRSLRLAAAAAWRQGGLKV
jgi:hypothetical protein